MYSNELNKLFARSPFITREISATEAGNEWALEMASYFELRALEEFVSNFPEETGKLSDRLALYLGHGKDVFWLVVRGKLSKDIDDGEALDFIHAANRVGWNFILELRGTK